MSWVGFDLDGTLAEYTQWKGKDHIGAPVPAMVAKVKELRGLGVEVRIFTARASKDHSAIPPIERWCQAHIGEVLPVTCTKDFEMWTLYDDRCVAVEPNTGRVLGGREP